LNATASARAAIPITAGAFELGVGVRLTIDLGALVRNWRRLARLAAPAECAAVVKADAYGIGIEHAVPALYEAGCRIFFVAAPAEGARTREVAPDGTVYVLGGFFDDVLELYRSARLNPVLNSAEEIAAWSAAGRLAPAALHFDTGMNRLGLPAAAAEALGRASATLAGIDLVMSHLACADEPDHRLNLTQLGRFHALSRRFGGIRHSLANSAGIHLGPAYKFDVVRPGIALYGGASHPAAQSEPVVTAEARILQVREAGAGETVGYGARHRLKRRSRLAIISAGYADGYLRAAGASDARSGGQVSIAGHAAPIVGRVSMDLIAADVTDVPDAELRATRWAELFGGCISVDAAASAAGTIGYELLTGLSRRASRVYLEA
jgi:alanine racemase